MRRSIGVTSFLGLVLALPVASLFTGCGSFWGCDADGTCRIDTTGDAQISSTSTGPGGEMGCPVDPLDGDVTGNCGIWVSTSLGDDKNPGTQDRPVRTLAQGIALASAELQKGGHGRLYACSEKYLEVVSLAAGVSLFGGFDCANDWHYVGGDKVPARATIQAPAALAALTLPASDQESMIADVNIVAADAEMPGLSSIGVLALPNSRAVFRRASIVAGNGANGANGADGGHGDASSKDGLSGQDGMDACTEEAGLGGLAVVTHCGDGTQPTGGGGGDGNEAAASDGLVGLPEPNPNVQGEGAGGKGQDAGPGTVCMGGEAGAHGKAGAHGFGASGDGTLTKAGYIGVPGGDGEDGLPGQGGGGGGASLGSALCGVAPHGGAGGGSGGAGGCGGEGGKGGQAGGSSLGIVLLSSGIRADATVDVQPGNGGNGGKGGAAQAGGQGGLPGYGGLGAGEPGGPLNGCAGGVGGHGGHGGDGGGGHGGHSFAVVQVGFNDPQPFTTHHGKAGEGGPGGSLDSLAEAGEKGTGANATTFN